jgi:hypothetical protein
MRRLNSLLLAAVAAAPLAASAQQGAPAQPPAPAGQTPPAAPPPSASQPAPAPSAGGKDDEFVPTQQLSADEAVTFPVDI